MTDEKKLAEIIARVIETKRAEPRISPSWVATEALGELDPSKISPELVYRGCHLALRQIARSQLRRQFGEDDEETAQHEFFGELQNRYPAAHSLSSGDEPVYVRREHMTKADVEYNVARLRSESLAKLAHADALEEWWRKSQRKDAAE